METYSDAGNATLASLDGAARFTEWMYAQVKPHLSGTILEIGSGLGTYSAKVIRDFPDHRILLSELDPAYAHALSMKFSGAANVSVLPLDLTDTTAIEALPPIDSAFALNVLEHIEHDELAFANMYQRLAPGGTFVVLVPAHRFLYNRLDRALGHFRRYSKKELKRKAEAAGFTVHAISFFNLFSIFGWYLNGTILGKETIDDSLLSIFDRFVGIFRYIEEKLLRRRMGISLVAVLTKSG